ncbi:MAG TPA: NAD(P)H-binding protein, partial [Bryobacteraceae bacterium]|nr:NAD(P)H-binding protein [Bryobacteraceae bacterium]
MTRVALVAGATGLVGEQCVRRLLDCAAYSRVIALVRRRLPLQQSKLEQRIVDFSQLQSAGEDPIHDVFCALGTTIRKAGSQDAFRKVDHEAVMQVAQFALASGASRMVLVSSVDAKLTSPSFYLRVKGEVERDLAQLPFKAVHILRPSFLTGNRTEARFGERIGIAAARALTPFLVGSLRRY